MWVIIASGSLTAVAARVASYDLRARIASTTPTRTKTPEVTALISCTDNTHNPIQSIISLRQTYKKLRIIVVCAPEARKPAAMAHTWSQAHPKHIYKIIQRRAELQSFEDLQTSVRKYVNTQYVLCLSGGTTTGPGAIKQLVAKLEQSKSPLVISQVQTKLRLSLRSLHQALRSFAATTRAKAGIGINVPLPVILADSRLFKNPQILRKITTASANYAVITNGGFSTINTATPVANLRFSNKSQQAANWFVRFVIATGIPMLAFAWVSALRFNNTRLLLITVLLVLLYVGLLIIGSFGFVARLKGLYVNHYAADPSTTN